MRIVHLDEWKRNHNPKVKKVKFGDPDAAEVRRQQLGDWLMFQACDWRICAAIRKDSIGMLCHIATVMHTLGICAMVFGLAALLIVGFLNIVQVSDHRSVA
jgi:hypothetical protein